MNGVHKATIYLYLRRNRIMAMQLNSNVMYCSGGMSQTLKHQNILGLRFHSDKFQTSEEIYSTSKHFYCH